MDWQPIDTAPKDGTRILLWNGDTVEIADWRTTPMGLGCEKAWYAWVEPIGDWNYGCTVENPSHWMPLPAPPYSDILSDKVIERQLLITAKDVYEAFRNYDEGAYISFEDGVVDGYFGFEEIAATLSTKAWDRLREKPHSVAV